MTILVLDALTQTVDIDKPFTSGVIRAALNDCYGMSNAYDVIYAYYGLQPQKDLPFKVHILGPKGTKDYVPDNKKLSGMVINKLKDDLVMQLSNLKFDVMIIHLHSYSSYVYDLCHVFRNIPKVFVVHDFILDVFTSSNMMRVMRNIKQYPNNIIISNSEFTQYLGNYIYRRRHSSIISKGLAKNVLLDLDHDDQNKFVDRAWKHFVYTNQSEPIAYDNLGYSINIGRFDTDKRTYRLLRMHAYNDHMVHLYGSYDPYHDPDRQFYNSILDKQKKYPKSYKVLESLSDIELYQSARNANNIVITCEHEGFGYTAYEMAQIGIPSIVITDQKFDHRHATSDYMKTAGLDYQTVAIKDYQRLYDLMKNYKLTLSQKLDLSRRTIEYFSLQNFIADRELAFQQAKNRTINYMAKPLF
jgi:hypothetical protein